MQRISAHMGSGPLLTIAIPTYNRAAFLELGLRRISEELDGLSTDQRKLVKVYISNNASTDDTAQVLSRNRYVASGDFTIANNAENIGGERNVVQCYVSATTPYVWVLGDDDVVLKGGLKMVLDTLSQLDPDILYVNGYSFSEDYLAEPKRGRGEKGVVQYSNALDFVRQTHIMLTSITTLVVRSGINAGSDSQVVDGSNLPQLGWVLPLIRDGKKFAVLKNRVFAAKVANSGGYGAINVFGNNLKNVANSILRNKPELARAIQNGAIVMWFPNYLMNLRNGVTEYIGEDVEGELKRLYGKNWRYFFFLIPLMSLPLKLAQAYFFLIRLTRLLFRFVLI